MKTYQISPAPLTFEVIESILENGVQLTLSNEAKDALAKKGWDPLFGARPLKRTIQKYVEDLLSEEIINDNVNAGDQVTLTYKDENDTFSIQKAKPKKVKK